MLICQAEAEIDKRLGDRYVSTDTQPNKNRRSI